VPMPPDFKGVEFGEPLLFRFVSWVRFGPIPEGYTVNLHPMGWAAWFGMLATALNLTPIGQLDGGHISYAVLCRKSGIVTVAAALGLVGLTVTSRGAYALWTMIVIAMLFVFGLHHPRALDEDQPLDAGRVALAILAALIFVLSFTPIPMTVIGLE
jgi:membrane-associated protease RseP (regulator of RpoE activity)